ncbi:hypothetical protein [Sorangium sp. So ce124]|uniref:hypothetical protein n=1 Tax=Sorangium sp. So ce124 TaxID=3133280 RepID=UPI003F61E128
MTKLQQPDVGDAPAVRPLTRCNAEGRLYQRSPAVQREIETVLGLESDELLASTDGLSDETLVYLIRERRRVRDWSVATKLSNVLVERCRGVLLSTLGSLPQDVRDEAIRTVLEQLSARIFALDDDRGDFYQVRFGLALKRLGTSAFRQCVLTIERHRRAEHDAETEHDAEPEWANSRNASFDPRQWPEDAVHFFKDAQNGLQAIGNDDHRMAFALHAMRDMPIESDDPETATISRFFGVSPRTIRNWLDQAEADLARWRRGKS